MTRFPDAFHMKYMDSSGVPNKIYMGCYGIGVSRVMGVIAEKFMDDKGLVWPESIAPFSHYLIVIGEHLEEAKMLAAKLESEGKSVLLDDRNTGFGSKAGDADLLGIPYRIVLSDKTLAQGGYELKNRQGSESQIITL
jgi:prolyl-tRNA synthetase